MKTGFLVLESGAIFPGQFFAGESKAGEVVFNTSHSGYEEIATDPSYLSQIVVMTAPMQGNYGVDDKVWESESIWIEGFVCLELQNSKRDNSWSQRLNQNETPILTGVDTRALTLSLRESGTSWGAIVEANSPDQARVLAASLISEKKKKDSDWVFLASTKNTYSMAGKKSSGPHFAVLDFGCKKNILRILQEESSRLTVFNSRATVDEIKNVNPDALMLTNGPGDPSDVKVARETVRHLLGKLPIFGICMGHQILALALGAKTYKLKFGHRGANHPIKDELLGRIYVTSQNHGYAVDAKSLPGHVRVTQTNLNDQTVAGIFSEKMKCLGIQYHPESCPGPHDAQDLFRYFIERIL